MNNINKYCNNNTIYELNDINHSESTLYINGNILYKKMNLFNNNMQNKINTVNTLINNKNIINIPEIILPNNISYLDKEKGIIIISEPFINNINLKHILKSEEYSFKEKINYLKEIGIILEKMKQVRTNTNFKNFFIGDLYPDNFILNKETQKINLIDTDSIKVNDNNNPSYYLYENKIIDTIDKYQKKELPYFTEYTIDENTDLFCYTIMLLNFISSYNINKFNKEEFNSFIEYLYSIGLSNNLLTIFSNIYSSNNNINPYPYIDELINYEEDLKHKKYILK